VAECSNAEEGVGATIAPNSQEEKGSCADFVRAARDKRNTGTSTAASGFIAVNTDSSNV
jgi:hypothetical protein